MSGQLCHSWGCLQRYHFSCHQQRSGKDEGENKKHKYGQALLVNSAYQFKLNISLLKSEVQPQNAALVKLLTYKIKARAAC